MKKDITAVNEKVKAVDEKVDTVRMEVNAVRVECGEANHGNRVARFAMATVFSMNHIHQQMSTYSIDCLRISICSNEGYFWK